MAHIVIDRRKNPKGKSTVNRKKFVDRVKGHAKDAVKEAIKSGKIADVLNNKNGKVIVPTRNVKEPTFVHGKGGSYDRVLPGNKEFIPGDRLPKPKGGGQGGGGRQASNDGDGEDDFQFTLTKEEFLDVFFDDLQLPNLEQKNIAKIEEFTVKRAGHVTSGSPNNLDLMRSMKGATGRRIALRNPKKKKLKALEKERAELKTYIDSHNYSECSIETDRLQQVEHEIAVLKKRMKAIPFIDDIDLRFHNFVKNPKPVTQAVMVCIMDVSGSMGEWEKEMAKRFFMLLYMFLTKNYKKIELVFIRHHTAAQEVNEEDFFYSKETGGTVVSSAIELADKIIKERFPLNEWNVFVSQASDGDNWHDDNARVVDLLEQKILPMTRYYAYIEILKEDVRRESDLWTPYLGIKQRNSNFAMRRIMDAGDIFPVFHDLFKKK